MIIEQLTKQDIEQLILHTKMQGWAYNRQELETLFAIGKIFGHKNKQNEIVSCAAIIPYDNNRIASIGMVLVNQHYRGLGLGKEVVLSCINAVPAETPIMLVASEAGKPLYEKLGFTTIDVVHKVVTIPRTEPTASELEVKITSFQNQDFDEVVKLDEETFGANRKELITHRLKQAKKSIIARNKNGKLIGFGLCIQIDKGLVIGPIIAPNDQIALLQVNKLADKHQGNIRMDIPAKHESFLKLVEQQGDIEITTRPLMVKEKANYPANNRAFYGMAGQTYG
ncbi:GNAT family N-acetyltransferase [Bacillus sp. REN16]|uniref:GNAT family N-acetyltransferase n=1 Tax=Bacillus sp. REN16 TaxID=2887296 RepID=UPI001E53E769|nr:GNAT family N-acetyltransferase [Bacillus sp. REN16]MCC3359192.1 GNAT family N-acetyltransferase [Bacillus sp. REN16]